MKTPLFVAPAGLVGLLLLSVVCHSQDPSRGAHLADSRASTAYRQTWALIIGINYTEGVTDETDRAQFPELNNGVNDAQLFAATLRTYYGDREDDFGYFDDAHLRVLIEDEATEENILSEVARLCDSRVVKPEDSVLVYFAGHAVRLDDRSRTYGDAVALLPYDARLSTEGEAIANTIGLPYGLVSRLKDSPAKHKLLILDCCYSGEVFELPPANAKDAIIFKDRLTETTDRRDRSLQMEPTFQALASCRRTQTASDGLRKHSPFTEALVDGLKRLPARFPSDPRVVANLLLFHIRPNPIFDESQKPDCRNLLGTDGEFCFYPSPRASFAQFRMSADEETLLQASVASRQGNWWFEEMPWFIPSVRVDVLQPREKDRTANIFNLIELKAIKKLTEEFVRAARGKDKLTVMRSKHAGALLAQPATDYEKMLEDIRDNLLLHYRPLGLPGKQAELTENANLLVLEASDVHLLAVVQHALRDNEASRASYQDAIRRYQKEIDEQERPLLHVLKALCEADLAELLLAKFKMPEPAAQQFRIALNTMRMVTGAASEDGGSPQRSGVFDIYVLCKEADAWSNVNHWKKANDCLRNALDKAKSLDPDHYLTAHVNRRRAWAEIGQWRLNEAQRSFIQSNVILRRLVRRGLDLQPGVGPPPVDVPVSDTRSTTEDEQPTLAPHEGIGADVQGSFVFPPEFHQSTDFAAKIAYLHNLHGIAMARRFQGDTLGAARNYRELVGMVETTITDFQGQIVDPDQNEELLNRIINTQERLGDCNLFGNPKHRDLKEALDDYRRAMHRIHGLRDHRERDHWTARLCYKQALALSLPSSIQDTALAMEMCGRADKIFLEQGATATGLYRALGLLTTHVVKLLDGSVIADSDSSSNHRLTASELRKAILDFRDIVTASSHRDELELCLFSSKVLLEDATGRDRYQVQEDADVLLSFCRIGLTPYRSEASGGGAGTAQDASDSRAYLRPYYDAVMRAKLHDSSNNVGDLLEIQREATQGVYYVKRRDVMPILATYVLDGKCYLIFDLPRGESKCVSLAEVYDVSRIRDACYAHDDQRLPLPRGVHDALTDWWREMGNRSENYAQWETRFCWWEDPIHGFVGSGFVPSHRVLGETGVGRPIIGHFPFQLRPPFETSVIPASAIVTIPDR